MKLYFLHLKFGKFPDDILHYTNLRTRVRVPTYFSILIHPCDMELH